MMAVKEVDRLARDSKITVMLSPKIKDVLQVYAESAGLTTSALCAFILGDFVRREEQILAPMTASVQSSLAEYLRGASAKWEQASEAALDTGKASG